MQRERTKEKNDASLTEQSSREKSRSSKDKSQAISQTHPKVGQAPDHSIGSPHVRGGHSSVNASHVQERNPMIPHKIDEDEEINFFDQENLNEGGPGTEKKDRMEWDPDKGEDVGQ